MLGSAILVLRDSLTGASCTAAGTRRPYSNHHGMSNPTPSRHQSGCVHGLQMLRLAKIREERRGRRHDARQNRVLAVPDSGTEGQHEGSTRGLRLRKLECGRRPHIRSNGDKVDAMPGAAADATKGVGMISG